MKMAKPRKRLIARYYVVMCVDRNNNEYLLQTIPIPKKLSFHIRLVHPYGNEYEYDPEIMVDEIQQRKGIVYKIHLKPPPTYSGKPGGYICDLLVYEGSKVSRLPPHLPPRPLYKDMIASASNHMLVLGSEWAKEKMIDFLREHIPPYQPKKPTPGIKKSTRSPSPSAMKVAGDIKDPIPYPPPKPTGDAVAIPV